MTADFNFDKPIYRQIMDRMCGEILRGEWAEGERIPAVRDYAMKLQVNPNTVMRSYENLQAMEVIESRRGIGYFVAQGAVGHLREREREVFLNMEVPEIFARMELLGVSIEEVVKRYQNLKR